MAKHRHHFEQKYERSIPGCTVKVWECPCGVWSIRHFGCFNANHDRNSLDTTRALRAQVARLEAAIAAKDAALGQSSCLYPEGKRFVHSPPQPTTCVKCAALSPDAGEGWLPPEVAKQVEELREAGEELCLVADTPIGDRVIGQRVGRSGEYVQVTLKMNEIVRFRDALAALDVLKGVE